MNNKLIDIIKGNIEGIEIHESYNSLSQLENPTPDTYLKKNNDCHEIPLKKVFTTYSTTKPNQPIGLSVLVTPETYEFIKHTPTNLKSLPYQQCSERPEQ